MCGGNGGKGRVGMGSGLAARCRERGQRGEERRADVGARELDIRRASILYVVLFYLISTTTLRDQDYYL